MGRIDLKKLDKAPVFRKIAVGTWNNGGDPSVYGLIDLEMSSAIEFISDHEKDTGIKLSPAHLVGKAIAEVLKVRPEINGLMRGSRIYLRKSVDLFYQVNVPGKGDGDSKVKKANLLGATIRGAENMTVGEIAQALREKVERVRDGKERTFQSTTAMLKWMPWFMVRWILNLTSFLTYGLNLNLSFLGIPRDPFGSVMITNVGSFGVERAWAPLVPYSRVPLLLTLGAITQRPVVINGQVVARPVMSVCVTFDHRFMDGFHASQMLKEFKKGFENPSEYFTKRNQD